MSREPIAGIGRPVPADVSNKYGAIAAFVKQQMLQLARPPDSDILSDMQEQIYHMQVEALAVKLILAETNVVSASRLMELTEFIDKQTKDLLASVTKDNPQHPKDNIDE